MTRPLTPDDIAKTRARLLEVALELFLAQGLDGLTLRTLARAAGISRSTPYAYFADKQDIIVGLRALGFDRLTACFVQGLHGVVGPLARMQRGSRIYVRFALDQPDLYRLMFSGPVFSDDVPPALAQAVARLRAVQRPALDDAAAAGLLRGDPASVRWVSWAAWHGLVSLHLAGHRSSKGLEVEMEALDAALAHGILQGDPP